MDPNTDSANLDESKKAILLGIIKQIKPGMEVKHLRLPSFVLQPRSTLEAMTDFFAHQHLILDLPLMADPEQRFLSVIKFYLAGFQARPKGVKKPFNPVIGEENACQWNFPDGSTSVYHAEQISHHPPHTAFCMYNDSKGVSVSCNLCPSYMKFTGNSAETKLQGMMLLTVNGVAPSSAGGCETYEMTLPSLVVKGILLGKLHMQTTGKTTLTCPQTGYACNFEFKSKGLFSSSKTRDNLLEAKITKGGKDLYTIKGSWDAELFISAAASKSKDDAVLFYNASSCHDDAKYKVEEAYDKLPPMDSKKVWEGVSRGIINRSDAETYAAKSAVEEKQRLEEAERAKTGVAFVPKQFVSVAYDKTPKFLRARDTSIEASLLG